MTGISNADCKETTFQFYSGGVASAVLGNDTSSASTPSYQLGATIGLLSAARKLL